MRDVGLIPVCEISEGLGWGRTREDQSDSPLYSLFYLAVLLHSPKGLDVRAGRSVLPSQSRQSIFALESSERRQA